MQENGILRVPAVYPDEQYIACSRPIMHLEHKAGDKVFINFAGDKLSNFPTGEVHRCFLYGR